MKTYRAHDRVEPGIYFNARHLRFKSMEDQGHLPTDVDGEWRRVPALALLVVGPLLGLAYAVFLPLIGFAMVGGALLRKAGELATEAAAASVRVLTPAWQPARAFLARRRHARAKATAERDAWAEEARRELADREDE